MPTLAAELANCAREQTAVTVYTSSASFEGTVVDVDEEAVTMRGSRGRRIWIKFDAVEALAYG